jgi:hypothetical protein
MAIGDLPANYAYRATTGNFGPFGAAGSGGWLRAITIGTGVASAVVTVYDGQDNTGTVVAVIDAAAKGSYWFGDLRLGKGIFIVLSGGNALVTVSYL